MKVGLIFPGYGQQYVGMCKELYDTSRIMQEYFDEASHCLDINFIRLCFASSDSQLAQIEHAYPALFLVSTALYAHVKELGLRPDVVCGISTGYYAALHAAGSITAPDGLYLLSKLAHFSQQVYKEYDLQAVRVRHMPIQALAQLVQEATAGDASIAYYEHEQCAVVAGYADAVKQVMQRLQAHKKVRITKCSPYIGLHSPVMADVVKQFEPYLQKVDFKDGCMPVVSNSTAQKEQKGAVYHQEVLAFPQSPVRMLQAMQQLQSCDILITMGPARELTKMVRAYYPEKEIYNILKPADVASVHMLLDGKSHEF